MKLFIAFAFVACAAMAHPATAPPVDHSAILNVNTVSFAIASHLFDVAPCELPVVSAAILPASTCGELSAPEAVPERGAPASSTTLMNNTYAVIDEGKSARRPFFVVDEHGAG